MATPLTPAQRALRAAQAANSRWASTPRAERAAAARRGQAGLLAKFEAEVPASVTDPAERAQLGEQAWRAHLQRLALRSSRSRAKGGGDGQAT